MTGPEATRRTVTDLFSLTQDGGICPFPGIVDFVQGNDMSGGVFITVRVDNPRIADDLRYLKAGNGKYTTFFRPYHLWFVEAPISVARAYLYNEPLLVPLERPVVDVLTIAKKDLSAGEQLDRFGGFTFHGSIDKTSETQKLGALPVGIAPGARMKRPVKKGEVIRWADVILDESLTVVKLRRQQDAQNGLDLL